MSHCRNILFSKDPFVFVFLVIQLLTYLIVVSVLVGEGNGTPLQYSCLENPMDRGAW